MDLGAPLTGGTASLGELPRAVGIDATEPARLREAWSEQIEAAR